MNTIIVLIPVGYGNARKACEHHEDEVFQNCDTAREAIIKTLNVQDYEEDEGNIMMFTMSDFMDEVNDQQLDVLTEYFLGYVNVEKI